MLSKVENKFKKTIIIMVIFQIMFMPISTAFSLEDIFSDGDEFLSLGERENGLLDKQQIKDGISSVYNIVFAIGVGLSVAVAAILGIKFMTGSVEEQAKIKEMIIPYVIGCIVVFGAFGIWEIVINMAEEVFN